MCQSEYGKPYFALLSLLILVRHQGALVMASLAPALSQFGGWTGLYEAAVADRDPDVGESCTQSRYSSVEYSIRGVETPRTDFRFTLLRDE